MTLEKAMERFKKLRAQQDVIDYYCARGFSKRSTLQRLALPGTLNNEDLQKASAYAKDVIDNSGRKLMANYEDIFHEAIMSATRALSSGVW